MNYVYRQVGPALYAAGYQPLPIKPGTKRPVLGGWQTYCSEPMPAAIVEHYSRSSKPYGIGLALGFRGLVAIDIVTDDAGLLAIIDCFDGASLGGAVAVVDLAEIEQGFLNGAPTGHPAVFHDAPVAVLLAILDSLVRT